MQYRKTPHHQTLVFYSFQHRTASATHFSEAFTASFLGPSSQAVLQYVFQSCFTTISTPSWKILQLLHGPVVAHNHPRPCESANMRLRN
ncbi:hypothetical protein ABKN59_006178 [Abortiporus biennis]